MPPENIHIFNKKYNPVKPTGASLNEFLGNQYPHLLALALKKTKKRKK